MEINNSHALIQGIIILSIDRITGIFSVHSARFLCLWTGDMSRMQEVGQIIQRRVIFISRACVGMVRPWER